MHSIETYPYGTNKGIIHKKEKPKYINIMKNYKKLLTVTVLQKKHKKTKAKLATSSWSSIQNINSWRLCIW